MKKRTLPGALAASLACCAFAQNEETNLPPVVVEATRLGRSAQELHCDAQIIEKSEIERGGYSSVADILRRKAGIRASEMHSNPMFAEVSMRGFGESGFGRVAIFVDGVPLANPDMHAQFLSGVPVSTIERIEVLRGAQAVLLGSGAEAGAINIITAASAEPKTEVEASIGAYDTYSARAATNGRWDDEGVSWKANADWRKSNGYRANSGYEIYNGGGSVRKDWDGGRWLEFGADYVHADYEMPSSLTKEQLSRNRRGRDPNYPVYEGVEEAWKARLSGETTTGAEGTLRLDTSARLRTSPWKNLYSTQGYESLWDTRATIWSYTVQPKWRSNATLFGHENQFDVGLDFLYDKLNNFSSSKSWSMWGNSEGITKWYYDRAVTEGFIRDEFFLADELSVALGFRGGWSESKVRNSSLARESGNDSPWALDASLLWRPADWAKTYVRGSRFYRRPFVDEIYSSYGGVANFDLDPENGWSLEVGGDVENDGWNAGASLWAMWMEDEVYYNPYTWQNLNMDGKTRREGLDLHAGWFKDKVGGVSLVYEYVIPEITSGEYDGKDIPFAPRHNIALEGEVFLWDELSFLADARALSDRYAISDFRNEGAKMHAFGLLDLAVRWTPQVKYLKGFKALFGVDNVFDKEYCDYQVRSSGVDAYYPAMGRFWKVSVGYEF